MAVENAPDISAYPHTKVSRDDWVDAALATLVEEGAERVKIMVLAEKLAVSRSSFYWYFKSRQELLDELIARWRDKNTAAIVTHADRQAGSIVQGVLNIFECWMNTDLFDPRLDFAIREWSRRSTSVRSVLDQADERRVEAITKLFERHGYAPKDAFIRARVLYFMQIGYYALDLKESTETRLSYVVEYLGSFTGREPDAVDLEYFEALKARWRLSGRA